MFAITEDYGSTWTFSNPVIGGIGIQSTIAKGKDGTLHAYLRDNGPAPKRIQHTQSSDQGLHWSIARDIQLPNPGAGFDMTTLSDETWLIVYNHTEHTRHNLTVAISKDEGQNWRWSKQLEQDDRGKMATSSHYPAVIQGQDGRIHVVYSYHRKDQVNG